MFPKHVLLVDGQPIRDHAAQLFWQGLMVLNCEYCMRKMSTMSRVGTCGRHHANDCKRYTNFDPAVLPADIYCPNGHSLKTTTRECMCAKCSVSFHGLHYYCSICDFDACPTCLNTTMKPRRPPTPPPPLPLRDRRDRSHRRSVSMLNCIHGITKDGKPIGKVEDYFATRDSNMTEAESLLTKLQDNPKKFPTLRFRRVLTVAGQSVLMVATDRTRDYKDVAVKHYFLNHARRAAQELEILDKLSHPNILKQLEAFKISHTVTFVFPLATSDLMKAIEPYDCRMVEAFPKLLIYAKQVVGGLKYLHEIGIVHLDLKCENCLIFPGDNVKISDFGLASEITGSSDPILPHGTPQFIAPEIFQGVERGDLRAIDIFAFGGLLYQLLSGNFPFSRQCEDSGEDELKFYKDFIGGGRYNVDDLIDRRWRRDSRSLFVTLIQSCMALEPSLRPSIANIYEQLG